MTEEKPKKKKLYAYLKSFHWSGEHYIHYYEITTMGEQRGNKVTDERDSKSIYKDLTEYKPRPYYPSPSSFFELICGYEVLILTLFLIGLFGIGVYVILTSCKQDNRLMEECLKAHKEYECYSMLRSGYHVRSVPLPMIFHGGR